MQVSIYFYRSIFRGLQTQHTNTALGFAQKLPATYLSDDMSKQGASKNEISILTQDVAITEGTLGERTGREREDGDGRSCQQSHLAMTVRENSQAIPPFMIITVSFYTCTSVPLSTASMPSPKETASPLLPLCHELSLGKIPGHVLFAHENHIQCQYVSFVSGETGPPKCNGKKCTPHAYRRCVH